MVYCGKASLGCSGCRKRRIKCDRRQPECTQCLRLSKPCPGYRDQLSLMFRDETVKVEKRVRASWGLGAAAAASSPTTSSAAAAACPTARSRKSTSPPGPSRRSTPLPSPPSSVESTSPKASEVVVTRSGCHPPPPPPSYDGAFQQPPSHHHHHHHHHHHQSDTAALDGTAPVLFTPYQYLGPTPSETGVSFYVDHYLLGYPDEVRNPSALSSTEWFEHPAAQATMAALGLAGMANLNNDKRLQHLSKTKYGEALAKTNEMLKDPVKNLNTAIRATVMLALFQCVHQTHEAHENARVHIMGCMALIKASFPIADVPSMGVRGVLQLCFSLLIPCFDSGLPMPDTIMETIRYSIAQGWLPPDEAPAIALIHTAMRFASVSAADRAAPSYTDDQAGDVMRQLLAIEEELDAWEASQQGKWQYTTHTNAALPPAAVFRQTYHRYADIWTSRVWSHFRWVRLRTNQRLLELAEALPAAAVCVPWTAAMQDRCYDTIRRMAVDVLTSVPTHYKHPRLTYRHLDDIQSHGGAGAGAVGIPHLMFHLQVAACAPGVPLEVFTWAVDLMETAWGELGMLHAKSLAEKSRNHRAKANTFAPGEGIVKFEDFDF